MTEEIEPRFTGWRRRINVNRLCEEREPIGLQVIWRKGPKFTGWMKKENQGLQVE